MTKLFSLTKTGLVYPTAALAGTPIESLDTASIIVRRRFMVEAKVGENIRLRPQFDFSVECNFSMRNLRSAPTASNARVFLLSSKDANGEPATSFAQRVPSNAQFKREAFNVDAALGETATVSFDPSQDGEEIPDSETLEIPSVLPSTITLTENSWAIEWLSSLIKTNDISNLCVKVKPESQEQFVVGLKKRIGRYHKAVSVFTCMQEMPQLETRIEDPVKDESIARRIEEGEINEGSFVSQDQIEKQRGAIEEALASLQTHLDNYSAAMASIPVSDLRARVDAICHTAILMRTAKPTDAAEVSEHTRIGFMVLVDAAINKAAEVVIARVSLE